MKLKMQFGSGILFQSPPGKAPNDVLRLCLVCLTLAAFARAQDFTT